MSHREKLEVGPLRQQAVCDLVRSILVAVNSKHAQERKLPETKRLLSLLSTAVSAMPTRIFARARYQPKKFQLSESTCCTGFGHYIYITIFLFQESLGGVAFYGSKFPQRFYQTFNDTLLVSLLYSLLEKNVKKK